MSLRLSHVLCSASVSLVLALGAFQVCAEDSDDVDALAKSLQKQEKKLEAEEKALKAQEKKMENERAEFDQLKAKIEKLSGKKITVAQEPGAAAGTQPGSQPPAAQQTAQTQPGGAAPQEIGTDRKPEQPDRPPEIAKYIEEGGVLLPKGTLLVTPSIEYDRSSATNVAVQGFSIIPALNIGDFDISQVNSDTLIGSIDALYAVTNRFEIEAKVPYVYSDQDTTGRAIGVGTSADTLTTINGQGIGDIEFGAHYQINQGHNDWPYFIGNLRFKTITGEGPFQVPVNSFGLETQMPTGSGFYALQPSVTIIYPSDPVVFYSNFGYIHNFQRSFATYGTIDPGDSISGSFGMSTSLNDATSFSIGYSHSMVFGTQQNGQYLPGSTYLQVGSVDLGWAYQLNDKISLNLNVSAGVTSDAPDDRVILRVPIAFDMLK